MEPIVSGRVIVIVSEECARELSVSFVNDLFLSVSCLHGYAPCMNGGACV